jgi:hypothetical protein
MSSGASGGSGGASSALDEPLREARELAVKGDLAKALAVVGDATARAPSLADRFRGRLASAQLCLGAGRAAIARGQLEGLVELIDAHRLETWDPGLCAEVYASLYGAIKTLNTARPAAPTPGVAVPPAPIVKPEDVAAERAAFERLCQLDPAQALKLSAKAP